jgi:hypothetical protein
MRTDQHCPANINPDDYVLHNHNYVGPNGDVEFLYMDERKRLRDYLNEGHRFEQTDNAGTCQCCGAYAHYVADFIYLPTGNIVRLGYICAEKMHIGDKHAFKYWKKAVADVRKRKAGKEKAKLLLVEDYGLGDLAFFVDIEAGNSFLDYKASLGFTDENGLYDSKFHGKVNVVFDIVTNLKKYGSLSEKQVKFLTSMWTEVKNFDVETYLAERQKKEDAKPTLKEGKYEVKGKVISFKSSDGYYGSQLKMLIEREDGSRVFGTCPARLDANVDDIVSFIATVKQSRDDRSFGFFSRPTQSKIVENNN